MYQVSHFPNIFIGFERYFLIISFIIFHVLTTLFEHFMPLKNTWLFTALHHKHRRVLIAFLPNFKRNWILISCSETNHSFLQWDIGKHNFRFSKRTLFHASSIHRRLHSPRKCSWFRGEEENSHHFRRLSKLGHTSCSQWWTSRITECTWQEEIISSRKVEDLSACSFFTTVTAARTKQ